MSIRSIGVTSAAFVLFGSAWLLAQNGKPPPAPQSAKESRFQICHAEDTVFLVDSLSGQTWLFDRKDGKPGWFPLPRWDEKGNVIPSQAAPVAERSVLVQDSAGSLRAFLESQGYARIKLNQSLGGYLTIKAKLGGKDMNLVLDTGAPNTHLDRRRTEKLGLRWRKVSSKVDKPEAKDESRHFLIDSLELEKFPSMRLQIFDHDLSDLNGTLEAYGEGPKDGVLGADVLGPRQAIINYQTYELFLFKGHSSD